MDIEDVKKALVGAKIVKIEADEFDLNSWLLNGHGNVEIHLDNDAILSSLGEPVEVQLYKR